MGIIDTLSAGLDLVHRKPWLILLPVIVDIGLWIAPRLSIAALMRLPLAEARMQWSGHPQAPAGMPDLVDAIEEAASQLNLGALLPKSFPGMPTLATSNLTSFFGRPGSVIEVPNELTFLGLVVALSLAGLLVGTLYLAVIGALVRDGGLDWGALARRMPLHWLRLLGAWLLMNAALMFLGLPMVLTLVLSSIFGQGAMMLTGWFALVALFWIMVYLAFVPQAILCGGDGVLQALAHSVNVVRMNFWPTVGLLVLIQLISVGLGFIWNGVSASAPGAFAAIVANAYIGTGLAAAIFIFYRDRSRALQQAMGQLRSHV